MKHHSLLVALICASMVSVSIKAEQSWSSLFDFKMMKSLLPSNKWSGSCYSAKAIMFDSGISYGNWDEYSDNYNVIVDTPDKDGNGNNWYDNEYELTDNSSSWMDIQAPIDNWCSPQNFGDIYIRREFYLDDSIPNRLFLTCGHDDAPCEYYLNGQLIWSADEGWDGECIYELCRSHIALLKPEQENLLAFHVHQNWGGMYADCGLYTFKTITIDDTEYVDLGLSSKTLWATRNIGANSPEEVGCYFAWGECVEKDYYTQENYSYVTPYNTHDLYKKDDPARILLGKSWDTPTKKQFEELMVECDCAWVEFNGIIGCMVTGPNGNSMFLPAGTFKDDYYQAPSVGEYGSYWGREYDSRNAIPSATELTFGIKNLREGFPYGTYFIELGYTGFCYCGRNIRPVYKSYVDIVTNFVDGTEVPIQSVETFADTLTYTRTFADTNWQPLYIPFRMEYDDWSEELEVAEINMFHQYDTDSDGTFDLTEMEIAVLKSGQTEPNTPYLVRAKSPGTVAICIADVTILPAEENTFTCASMKTKYSFIGSYSSMQHRDVYVLQDGELVRCAMTEVVPQRWYMMVNPRGTAKLETPARIRIRMTDEFVDNINLVQNETVSDDIIDSLTGRRAYDLSGRLIQEEGYRGIVIKNRKKLIKR